MFDWFDWFTMIYIFIASFICFAFGHYLGYKSGYADGSSDQRREQSVSSLKVQQTRVLRPRVSGAVAVGVVGVVLAIFFLIFEMREPAILILLFIGILLGTRVSRKGSSE